MIRLAVVYDPAIGRPVNVAEYGEHPSSLVIIGEMVADLLLDPGVSSFSVQRVTQWWPATWGQLTPGTEVLGDDGATWVVSRGISELSPHEVEIYRFGQPETRFTFTPQYDQAVQARVTQESSMRALLMTELGARLVDDGG